ncbi:Bax inhibitor-1/YccA family protein [Candidatus Pseudothioglobus sp. Uisw_041]|jgi:modulator of FtsH protease|uniref:Bax inhibitor-1/YccA family protein n=1 Tax=unclassified Candidatus Pseudothioglobus TaxID=3072908 RepID=UPI002336EA13|nr:Bax inhibitor-1/YccA family protein [Gammaproteobacteria bacterium]MDB4099394.1 Bax inhibitor-1/YccA family protein [Candidatus Thioglobus sp.]MDB9938097.1 Bax inhibitor-1/YccA family protein [Candidatus Thioglobus sp.]MDC3361096.1 Bax inhibitor-1/YccA family protein [Candidatus Thioglobus sp.]
MPTNVQTTSSAIVINRTLRNTYQLLSATLLFSGLMAYLSMYLRLPYFGLLITLGGYFGLLFLVAKLRNSAFGILAVFALTGFMGLTLGPIVGAYTTAFSNGAELVGMAMTGTAVIFLSLSFYAITSQKDFSFMSGFLTAGIVVAFLAGIAAYFFQMPALSLAVSSAFILLMSGLILYETSNIIHGGETNYIMATVTLYISIYNLFLSLLHLLGVFSGDD